jgi:hypothetical protein
MRIDGVLLARHGETDDNAVGRFQGHREARRVLAGCPPGHPVVENGSVHRL